MIKILQFSNLYLFSINIIDWNNYIKKTLLKNLKGLKVKNKLLIVSCLIFMVSCKNPVSKEDNKNTFKKDTIVEQVTNKVSYGLYSYLSGEQYKSVNLNTFKSVSYMAYELNPNTGEATNTHDWLTTKLIDSLKVNDVKSLLMITNDGEFKNKVFLSNTIAINTLIDNSIRLILNRDADGIHINFDNITISDKDKFTAFIMALKEQLSRQVKSKILLVTIPNEKNNNNVFDFMELNKFVDQYIIIDSNKNEEIKNYYMKVGIPESKIQVAMKF